MISPSSKFDGHFAHVQRQSTSRRAAMPPLDRRISARLVDGMLTIESGTTHLSAFGGTAEIAI
jgi:hypothetical protein